MLLGGRHEGPITCLKVQTKRLCFVDYVGKHGLATFLLSNRQRSWRSSVWKAKTFLHPRDAAKNSVVVPVNRCNEVEEKIISAQTLFFLRFSCKNPKCHRVENSQHPLVGWVSP